MAIVHADNFSIYGSSTGLLLNGVYAQTSAVSLPTDPDGISSGRVMSINGTTTSSRGTCRYVLPSFDTKVGIAVRLWMEQLPFSGSVHPIPLQWLDGGAANLATVTVDTTGRLVAHLGNDSGSVLATTPVPVVTANGWWHLEGMIDTDTGEFEVRVEGVPVIELTGVGFPSVAVAQTTLGSRISFQPYNSKFKDYVIWTGAGSSNNDFLGSVIVHNLTPTSDVDLNWTPSTGSAGYSILDNIPPVDSEYIFAEDSPIPDPYVATLSDLPPEVTSVKALVTFVRAAKNDGGDGSLQVGIISDPDGTPATGLGADRPITVAQTYWRDVFELDPATSAAWLPNAVNQAQLQINRTT